MPLFNLEFWLLIKYDNLNTIIDINMKLRILAYHDKEQLQDNEHYSESNMFEVMSPFVKSIIYINVAHYSKSI